MRNFLLLASTLYLLSCNSSNETAVKNSDQLKNIENRESFKKSSKDQFVSNAGNLGFWELDKNNLPVFNFTAQIPLITKLPNGEKVDYPVDPWFLIGNYKLNCFVHASGAYQLMSMERAISRLNPTGRIDSAYCRAIFTIDDKPVSLSNISSDLATDPKTKKTFGIGSASFDYELENNVDIKRTLSTVPSTEINEGCSGFLINVDIINNAEKEIDFSYQEGLDVCYQMVMNVDQIEYLASTKTDIDNKRIVTEFIPKEKKPLTIGRTKDDFSLAEGYPPKVFIQAFNGNVELKQSKITDHKSSMDIIISEKIMPGESKRINFVVGYFYKEIDHSIDGIVKQLALGTKVSAEEIPFRKEWRNIIPKFENETDKKLLVEMQCHAGMLESMANFNDYYKETYIPQGTRYEYGLGVSCCLNDIAVYALPVSYYNRDLAKSIIRYTLKHADAYGFMFAADMGAGRMGIGSEIKSNSYPYTIFALSEYLNETKDASFLNEVIELRYNSGKADMTVLDLLERLVIFCRDELGTGTHGIPKMLDSDWNDSFYYFFKDLNFHHIFRNAESHMNATMFIQYFNELSVALKELDYSCEPKEDQEKLKVLIEVIDDFQKDLLNALIEDIGDKEYVYRAYIKDIRIGEDNLFLEPQIFAVGIKGLPLEKRKEIWQTIKTKLWDNEKKGARQNEKGCETEFKLSQPGSRENGGFWYSLNGPLMVNLIDIDKEAAIECLHRMTLMRHGEDFPDYWPGMWSGGDSFDSSMLPTEGVTGSYLYPFPVFCAHAHSWPLWGYYRLQN